MKESFKHIWNMQISVELSFAHVAVAHTLTATALLRRDGAIQHSISRIRIPHFLGIQAAM